MSNGAPIPHNLRSATANSFERVLDAALAVLSLRPSALVTDIDGTISPIVPRPEDATVDATISRALAGLSRALDLVAVITARDEATARAMVGAKGVTYVGNYGRVGAGRVEGLEALVRARAKAGALVAGLPCVQVEKKATGFSLHYRNCDDPIGVRARLLEAVIPLAEEAGAKLVEGKKVIELVPRSLPDKRTAFARLVDSNAVRGLVCLGDDLSDASLFQEIADRRRKGSLEGVTVAVVDEETDAAVREAADTELHGVEEVGRLLVELSQRLAPTGRAGDAG